MWHSPLNLALNLLRITDIYLRNFRSYPSFELHNIGELTIFVGPNASGKTNAIEAIQLLTALASFRAATSSELLRQGESHGRAQICVEGDGRQLELELAVEDGSRAYCMNGKRKQTRDLRGLLPSVAFTPDDLNLVKGSDRHRRHELDVLGSQLNANYHQLVRDYEKVLRHKNKLLKDGAPLALIDATNEVFAKVSEQLTNYREALFNKLIPKVASHYSGISGGEQLSASYEKTHAEDVDLAALVADEFARGRALAGPHLDKICFFIDGLDAHAFASQGQQRSVVLSLKLAEAEVIEEMLGQLPVLLLDDVMSELDGARREALVSELLQGKQTFITTANIDYFDEDMLSRAKVCELG